jgi:hypothetical protein
MSYSYAQTISQSSTYTEARARYIMGKVYEDLLGLMGRSLIDINRADQIRSNVQYLLEKQVLKYFQLQFKKPSGDEIGGLHYQLKADGNIYADEKTGGLNYWSLPSDTRVNLLVDLDYSSPNIDEVNRQLEAWGGEAAMHFQALQTT